MYLLDERENEGSRGDNPELTETGTTAEWVRNELGFEPDAAQTRVLNTGSRRVLLNCTRQWGKSTVTAAKAVHRAQTMEGSLTLVVSPSARQSGEFLRKAQEFARRLKIKPRGDGDNEISLLFPNRSRIVGLPGNEATVRGFSAVGLMLVDEASRVSDELYLALRPMLAVSGGTLWLMSTPFGKRGFFWEAWQTGGRESGAGLAKARVGRGRQNGSAGEVQSSNNAANEWERVRVPAQECPRIPAEFLEEERRTMGDKWYRQEYECEFVDAVSGLFDRDAVDGAMREDVEPLEI